MLLRYFLICTYHYEKCSEHLKILFEEKSLCFSWFCYSFLLLFLILFFSIVPVGVSLSPGLFYILKTLFEMMSIPETHRCYKHSQKKHISLNNLLRCTYCCVLWLWSVVNNTCYWSLLLNFAVFVLKWLVD